MKKKIIYLFLLLSLVSNYCFSEENKINSDENSQFSKDLRRFEIITLGSMPFVTMDISLIYSAFNSNYALTPFLSLKFEPSSQDLSSKEKWNEFWAADCGKVIIYSALASLSVGISDFTIRYIRRSKIKSKKKFNAENIVISDLENDPDAIKLDLPEKKGDAN